MGDWDDVGTQCLTRPLDPFQRLTPALDHPLVGRVVEQLLELEPEATAVLLIGSYAKGTAGVASDLDLIAITPSPRVAYRTWFEEQSVEAPLHVSAGATTADEWLEKAKKPAPSSFGFPAINTAAYLSTDDATRARLGNDPSLRHPTAEPELEDFFEFVLNSTLDLGTYQLLTVVCGTP